MTDDNKKQTNKKERKCILWKKERKKERKKDILRKMRINFKEWKKKENVERKKERKDILRKMMKK